MYIIDISTGKKISVTISRILKNDFKLITQKDFFFNWRAEDPNSIYKLYRDDDESILGLISFDNFSEEQRIHVNLIAVSKVNKGKQKNLDRIAGNLLAFAGNVAISLYGYEAAISLIPKTELVSHYVTKYRFQPAGRSLFMDGKELIDLINQYYYE